MFVSIEDGKLTEPGGEPREVKVRMVKVKCLKCKKILNLTSAGVAHDPVKGIYMNPEEDMVTHADLSDKEKKQLLKEINHG